MTDRLLEVAAGLTAWAQGTAIQVLVVQEPHHVAITMATYVVWDSRHDDKAALDKDACIRRYREAAKEGIESANSYH